MFGLTCLLDGVVTRVLQARGKEPEQ
jgi:hypothetical protein